MAVPLGIVLVWLGYSIGYYGFNRITGGNDSFVSLVYPGRYTPTNRDGGSSGSSTVANPNTVKSNAGAPAGKTPAKVTGPTPNVNTGRAGAGVGHA